MNTDGDSEPKSRCPCRTMHASCSLRESWEKSELMRRLLVYKELQQHWDLLNPPSRWLAFSLLAEAALGRQTGQSPQAPRCGTRSYYKTWVYVLHGMWKTKNLISFLSLQTLTPPLPISLKIRGPWHTYIRPFRPTFYLWTMTTVKWKKNIAVLWERLTPLTTFINWYVF